MFKLWRRRKRLTSEIHPDEILLDSSNQAGFDTDRFEGRMERALPVRSLALAAGVVGLGALALLVRAGNLQLAQGAEYAKQAQENQLQEGLLIADRGHIVDRTGRPLAWNERGSLEDDYANRLYAAYRGIAHAVGYAKAPQKDTSGFYFRESFEGMAGAEAVYNTLLAGQNGLHLTETNARGELVSEATVRPPKAGQTVTLSLDAKVSQGLYDTIAARADAARAQGGAGVIIDVRTGEILALVSYPEYNPQKMEQGDAIALGAYNSDKRQPFLDRAVDGLYAPGSIVKPVMAVAALSERVISEHKQILSTGQISIPNPYDASKPTIFRDWRVNGWTDAREAIAVSSDVYFYAVGGGFEDQKGLGIARIDDYLKRFGLGQEAGLSGFSTKTGTIPTPEWKAATFPDDPTWRLGNTYHTSIGQYGTLVTPLQAVRMTAAVATGNLLTPTLLASSTPHATRVQADAHALEVAREGMRQGVTSGIATAVNMPFVQVAAKTGTAQVGMRNENQNAWMVGFWPFDNPHWAYAVVLEKMPAGTQIGGSGVMQDFFYWLEANAPEYLQ